jgi:preprotein translocase subunit YajC
MNPTHFLVLAQAAVPAAGQAAPNPIMSFVPLIFICIIFYFLLIRPQQKRQKEHQQPVSAVKTGDRVITSSGIHGVVANVKDKTVIVKVADNVKIEFDRSSITSIEKADKVDTSVPAISS